MLDDVFEKKKKPNGLSVAFSTMSPTSVSLQPVPPLYNATNVKVPVVLFSGDKDWLADVEVRGSFIYISDIQAYLRKPFQDFRLASKNKTIFI